jgi:hypothetical protein
MSNGTNEPVPYPQRDLLVESHMLRSRVVYKNLTAETICD